MKRLIIGSVLVLFVGGCDKSSPQQEPKSVALEPTKADVSVAAVSVADVAKPAPVPALEWSASVFSFVVEEEGRFYVVLQGDGLENVKSKKLTLLNRIESVEAELAPSDIPAVDQKLVGKTFALFGEDGELCKAKVEAIVAIARAENIEFDGDNYDKAPKSKLAKILWEKGQRMRVARLETNKKCSGAIWGRDTAEKPANVLTRFEPDADTKSQILKRFKTLPGFAHVQKEYVEHIENRSEQPESDWTKDKELVSVISGFKDPINGREYIQIAMQGETGCGAANAELWAIFMKGSSAQWEIVSDPDKPGTLFSATLAVDANLDGHPEFVAGKKSLKMYNSATDRQLVERKGKIYKETRETEISIYGCGC